MSRNEDPHGADRWDKGATDSVEDDLLMDSHYRREPTDRELDAMNAQHSDTAHQRDWELYGPHGTKVVQVRIAGAGRRTYTYEVPRNLEAGLGTWVRLPGNVVTENGGFGVVKGFGRQGYDGPLKQIVAVVPEPDEYMIRMTQVKSKEQAADLYDEAVASGRTDLDFEELAVLGCDRLKSRGIL